MTTRWMLAAAACAALAACGGDDGVDPAAVHFTYGAPVAATVGSSEQYAAEDGSLLLSDGATLRAAGDATAAEIASGSLPMIPDDMASYVFDGGMVGMAPGGVDVKRVAGALAGNSFDRAALGDGFDDPGCVTASPGEVRYTSCVLTMPEQGMAMAVNGTFGRAGDVVSWDVTMTVTMTDVDFTMTSGNHLHGSITFGASTIVGQARSDQSVNAHVQGQSVRAGATTIADLDLEYVAGPFCVTGGTLELRRVWTRRPTGATSADLPDQGVKFTWQGCGQVLVAWGQ